MTLCKFVRAWCAWHFLSIVRPGTPPWFETLSTIKTPRDYYSGVSCCAVLPRPCPPARTLALATALRLANTP